MKRILLIAFGVGLLPLIAAAQGTVNFGTSDINNHKVVLTSGAAVGAGYSAGLYWAPLGSSTFVLLTPIAAVNGGSGFIAGGTRTTGVSTPEGASGTFRIKAWNGGFATYEDALALGNSINTLAGQTPIFTNATGAPNGSPPTPAGLLSGWTAPIVVVPIPEPATIALAGLGAAALLIFRRRK